MGELIQEAVKIKEQQMKSGRRIFDAKPEFFQHTLFHGETEQRVQEGRKQPVQQQIDCADVFKQEGNDAFKNAELGNAIEKYERSLALLWYFEPTDPDWRKKGIQDELMRAVDVRDRIPKDGNPDNEALQRRATELITYVLTNIAFVYLRQQLWAKCVEASSMALHIDGNAVKPLYFRAKARISAPSSGGVEYEQALADLKHAKQVAPTNKSVLKLLASHQKTMREQQTKDKEQYAGLFNRGEVVDHTAEESKTKMERDLQRIKEENKKQYEHVTSMARGYRHQAAIHAQRGETAQAQKANATAAQLEHHLKSWNQKLAWDQMSMGPEAFENPTPDMIAQAQQFGVDLNDPAVKEYLKELESEKQRDDVAEAERIMEETEPSSVNWRFALAVAAVIILWRLVSSGLLGRLVGGLFSGSDENALASDGGDEDVLADDSEYVHGEM